MHDGTCPCGIPHSDAYDSAMELANVGVIPVPLDTPDGLSLSGYQPNPGEIFVFTHEQPHVRAMGHVAVAVHTRREIREHR